MAMSACGPTSSSACPLPQNSAAPILRVQEPARRSAARSSNHHHPSQSPELPSAGGRCQFKGRAMCERSSRDRHLHADTRLVHDGTLRSEFGETSEALFLTQGHVYASAEEC